MSAGDDRGFFIKIDGVTYPHLKEVFDFARKVREEFVSVLNCLETID